MREFMKQHRVPDASIAVTNAGKVVFARGYGYADVGSRKPVDTDSLFRIASICKPITASQRCGWVRRACKIERSMKFATVNQALANRFFQRLA